MLTGATGFIGSHILEALTAAGWPVIALARAKSDLSHLRGLKAEVRSGNLCDPPSLRVAVRGCSQVIHAAARASDWGPRQAFFDTNVTGTANLLEACRGEGVSHIILTGSISSYGEEDSPVPKDETWPGCSHYPYWLDRVFPCAMNYYRDSKRLATEQAVDYARAHRLNLTVLEPVWVYGEREFGTGFYSYLKAVQAGQKWMPGSRTNRFHVIYARDLAKAYLLACRQKLTGVHRLIIGSDTAEPMQKIFGTFCREAGLPSPRHLPKACLYPLGLGLEILSALTRRATAPLLTRGRVNMFYDSIQFSTAKAQRTLGFKCDYSLEAGIRRTVDWYKENHYL